MSFIEVENQRQSEFKYSSPYFSDRARADGVYLQPGRVVPCSYCLPLPCAEENLFPEIRAAAVAYFQELDIWWHDAGTRPSNHMRDSQVCCVNFLFPLAQHPDALAELLRPIFPALRRVLPIEASQFVAFEWIGLENYLNNAIELPRQRGKGCTSSDAAVLFENERARREIALLNWKYTETYSGKPLHVSQHDRDRVSMYRPFYQKPDCPLDKGLIANFEDLFYDPFDQLMRLQFLGREMERARELEAERVTLVNIVPAANAEALWVSSPNLRSLGATAPEVWKGLVSPPDRFAHVSTEKLFGALALDRFSELWPWWTYLTARHLWLVPAREAPAP